MGRDERWLAERSHAELEQAWVEEQLRRQERSPLLRRGPSRGALFRIEACDVVRKPNRLVSDFRAVAFRPAKAGVRASRPMAARARGSRRVAKVASSDDSGPSEPGLAEAHAEGGTA